VAYKLKFNTEKKEDIIYWRLYVPGMFGFQISWAKTKPGDKGWYSINGEERYIWFGRIKNEKAMISFIGRLCAGIVMYKPLPVVISEGRDSKVEERNDA
jgi:hypothetical protein